MLILMRTLFVIDLLAIALLLFFFLDGLQYAPQPSYFANWLVFLGVPIAMVVTAWALASNGRPGFATSVLAVLSAAPIGYLLFFGVLLATTSRWN